MSLDQSFYDRLSRFLPAELLGQINDSKTMAAVIRRLNSLNQSLSSFLPQYIAENETFHTQEYGAQRLGTFMFADVSGFTALSEKLQREGGREGAEILTQIINDYFGTMLEILAKSNGQLLKFAGDALLTFFPNTPGEDETPLAIRTGLRMQRSMREKFQPIIHPELNRLFGTHNLQLTMSIGVARGKLFEAVVGTHSQRDHIIQGRLPGLAMAAEGAGDRDDVIIDEDIQAQYATQFETVSAGDGFFRVVDNFGDQLSDYEFVVPRRRRGGVATLLDMDESNLIEDLRRQLERVENVARFVAAEVVDKLAFQGDHIVSENRPGTIIFMYFSGFADLLIHWGDEQVPLITSILGRYYGLMQRVVVSNGGSLIRTDPYQQGVKMLITFGAPVAHADDPERAVTTALEMNRQLALFNDRLRDELPETLHRPTFITQRIGITHGPVFAGEVGWRARREYTVMGDDVNLAARLMGKGEMGQILISSPVWEHVNPHFECEALTPFQLKGKSQPTQAYSVKASTASALDRSPTSDTPFIGRDFQLITLAYALQQAKRPRRRQILALTGETGVGKTRMAKQIVIEAENTGFRIAWANCQRRHSRDNEVWAAVVAQLLELAQAKSEQAQRRLLNVRLTEIGAADLEPALIEILFQKKRASGSDTQPSRPRSDSAATDTKPKSLFQMTQSNDGIQKSGIFGAVGRKVETGEQEAVSKPSLWQGIARQTSLPDCMMRLLQAFCDEVPTLLVMDNLHEADTDTLTVLKTVMDGITRGRLVLLLTYEPDVSLDLNIRRTTSVGDLERDEMIILANRFLKADIGPRLADRLWAYTHGRPLYVEELLKLWQTKSLIGPVNGKIDLISDDTGGAIPDMVSQLVISQIDRLPPEARSILQSASVLGSTFTLDALGTIHEGADLPRMEATLRDLLTRQTLEKEPDGSYSFRQGVAHIALYESLNRLQRLKLHKAAAAFCEQQDGDHLIATITHLARGGVTDRAKEMLNTAIQQAEADGQIERALGLCRCGAALFPTDETTREIFERLQAAHGG